MTTPIINAPRQSHKQTFDAADYMAEVAYRHWPHRPDRMDMLEKCLNSPWGAREICNGDVLLFAIKYFKLHLRSEATGNRVTFGTHHLEWAQLIEDLCNPADRTEAIISPRGAGKSTWWWAIAPAYWLGYQYVPYVMALADSATQAEIHLQTFRHECLTNEALRKSFPDLCTPATSRRGLPEGDRRNLYKSKGGVFSAHGIDSALLGFKVGNVRPAVVLCDDIEGNESNYSLKEVNKRLATLLDAIYPIGDAGTRKIIVGTNVRSGSIIDQIINYESDPSPDSWVAHERVALHWAHPWLELEDGTRRSFWPQNQRFSEEEMMRQEAFMTWGRRYSNVIAETSGGYWTAADWRFGTLHAPTLAIAALDPAQTGKKDADSTGLAVVAYSASERKLEVRDAVRLRVDPGEGMRGRVLSMLAEHPDVTSLVVEINVGGEPIWRGIFHDMPVPVICVRTTVGKPVRFAKLLGLYQRGYILHSRPLSVLQSEEVSYDGTDDGLDDVIDSVELAVDVIVKHVRSSGSNQSFSSSYV
jgi:hypothetical protein